MTPEKRQSLIEEAKRHLCDYHECTWKEFVDRQEPGDCQVIAHSIAHDLPQFKHVFGEIEVEPYRDEDGEEQYRMTHHWVTLDGEIYDFAKGTLRGRLEVEEDHYDPEVLGTSIYQA
jgi:hypothetical protein